jgi:hypothetical protein
MCKGVISGWCFGAIITSPPHSKMQVLLGLALLERKGLISSKFYSSNIPIYPHISSQILPMISKI